MQPTPARPRRDDERNAWLPFVIVAALIVLLFLALIIVFRRDDEVDRAEGSLPLSFDPVPSAPASTTTASTIPPATPPPVVVPTTKASGGSGSSRTDAPSLASTTLVGGPAEALAQAAERAGATTTSDIVPIGADLYAMILVNGRAQLLRWNAREWEVADRLDPPGTIRDVATVDVTGDGIQDFLITLGGIGQPGGVYSRATFEFGLLPFNTVTGKKDFVDGLVYRLGKLQSPFRDASGSRTLTWTWTGEMFETR